MATLAVSGFNSAGSLVSEVLRSLLEAEGILTMEVLGNCDEDDLNCIAASDKLALSDNARIALRGELAVLGRCAEQHARRDCRRSIPPSSSLVTVTSASASGKKVMHAAEQVPSAKLSKALGKRVLDDADDVGPENPPVIQKKDPRSARKDARYLQAATELWEFFVQLGSLSEVWAASLEDIPFRAKAARTRIDRWAATNSVQTHCRILKVWIAWCNTNELDWKRPDSFMVMEFLHERCSDKPTKAKSYFNSLRWLEMRIGLKACTDLQDVRRASDPPPEHESHQEPPWILGIILLIEKGMASGNIFLALLCLLYCFLAISGIRPIHTQRLVIKLRKNFLEFTILHGKRQVRGRQTKVYLGCPFGGFSGASMHDLFTKLLELGFCTQDKPFMMPDWEPRGANFDTATGFTTTPMGLVKSRNQLMRYLRARRIPTDIMETVSGNYGLRHVLATVADRVHAPDDVRRMVGDWQEKAKKGDTAMPDRYSFARSERHAEVREDLILLTRKCCMPYMKRKGIQCWTTWDELFDQWPKGAEGRYACVAKYNACDAESVHVPDCLPEKGEQSQAASASSDSSSGDETSSVSSIGSEDLDIEWQLSAHPKGLMHYKLPTGIACNKQPLKGPTEGGTHKQARAKARKWCLGCYNAMPMESKEWILKHSSESLPKCAKEQE